jgi:hypothetical protein
MEYDYTGMRVKKNAPSGISLYPFQGYEIDPNGIITKFIKIGIETFASKRGTNKYFYHNDHLGGVNVITDIAGTRVQLNEYDPWGSVSRAVGSIDPTRRFNGKELDPETGLYYYGGRYYAPASLEHGTLNLENYPKVHRLRCGRFTPPFLITMHSPG